MKAKKLTLVLCMLMIIGLCAGCVPVDQGDDFQYLGRLHELRWNCDVEGNRTTILVTRVLSITISGKVELHGLGSIGEFHVWVNVADKVLRLAKSKKHRITADYHVISIKTDKIRCEEEIK